MLQETALIITCASAEEAVGEHRRRFDRAAAFGVPAHVTVLYPFRPYGDLTGQDHDALAALWSGFAPFAMRLVRFGWFEGSVLHLALEDPSPVLQLTRAVVGRFPAYPPYGGAHALDDLVPHLTVGHSPRREDLLTAEAEITPHLPVTVTVDAVELWAGPSLAGQECSGWRRVRRFGLGARAG